MHERNCWPEMWGSKSIKQQILAVNINMTKNTTVSIPVKKCYKYIYSWGYLIFTIWRKKNSACLPWLPFLLFILIWILKMLFCRMLILPTSGMFDSLLMHRHGMQTGNLLNLICKKRWVPPSKHDSVHYMESDNSESRAQLP